jgi:two-component system nitrate/nitrite response regulator NarL
MLTADHDPEGMGFAMAAGAAGYVHKSCGLAALVAAIRQAYDGDPVELLAPPPGHRALLGRNMDAVRLASFLTQRERQCLAMLADGHSTAAMAQRLGVSAATVRTHVQAVLTKLGVHSRLQAASLAVLNSLVDSKDLLD